MDLWLTGRQAVVADLEPGACFALDARGKAHFAIKGLWEQGDRRLTFSAIIAPGLDDYGGFPGIVYEAVAYGPILHLPRAVFRPSVDLRHFHDDDDATRKAGWLLQSDDQLALVVKDNRQTTMVSVETGKIVTGLNRNNSICYSAWEILLPDINGKHHVISQFDAMAQRK